MGPIYIPELARLVCGPYILSLVDKLYFIVFKSGWNLYSRQVLGLGWDDVLIRAVTWLVDSTLS